MALPLGFTLLLTLAIVSQAKPWPREKQRTGGGTTRGSGYETRRRKRAGRRARRFRDCSSCGAAGRQEFRRFRVLVCRKCSQPRPRSSGYTNGVNDFLRLLARDTVTETVSRFAISRGKPAFPTFQAGNYARPRRGKIAEERECFRGASFPSTAAPTSSIPFSRISTATSEAWPLSPGSRVHVIIIKMVRQLSLPKPLSTFYNISPDARGSRSC